MKSHKRIAAAQVFEKGIVGKDYLLFQKLLVVTDDVAATNAHFVTITVENTNKATETYSFSALVGEYCGPFQFDCDDKVTITPETDTIALLCGFSYSN